MGRQFSIWALAGIGFAVLSSGAEPRSGSGAAFDRLKMLAGVWESDSPAGGKLTSTFVLVSKGTAIEETIGTPADNEASLYTRDGSRILMMHYCALTAGGSQARLETGALTDSQNELVFSFVSATSLARLVDPHMHRMVLTLLDGTHFSEVWTMREKGKDTVFALNFVRK